MDNRPLPPITRFVETLPTIGKRGRNLTKTHKHYLAPCDVCGRRKYVAASKVCCMTPDCTGKHKTSAVVDAAPVEDPLGSRRGRTPEQLQAIRDAILRPAGYMPVTAVATRTPAGSGPS